MKNLVLFALALQSLATAADYAVRTPKEPRAVLPKLTDGDVNVGSGTAPETFIFERNHWFAEDMPEASKP